MKKKSSAFIFPAFKTAKLVFSSKWNKRQFISRVPKIISLFSLSYLANIHLPQILKAACNMWHFEINLYYLLPTLYYSFLNAFLVVCLGQLP